MRKEDHRRTLGSNSVQFWISVAGRENWACKWDTQKSEEKGRKYGNCGAAEIKARRCLVNKWSLVVICGGKMYSLDLARESSLVI